MIHLVQIGNGRSRRVAMVEEPHLRCLTEVESVYELAQRCMSAGVKLSEQAMALAHGERLDYDAVYSGNSEWRLLAPIDVPREPSRLDNYGHWSHPSGKRQGSAGDAYLRNERAAETVSEPGFETLTDSMRMFQWGVAGGRPKEGEIGVAPEWFYKGSGSMLRGPFEPLVVPTYAEDGGEEAEVAGIYIIGDDGAPYRIGMVQGNEFSDHQFEKRNYLNLAGSKLRTCSVGPELVIGGEFGAIAGEVRIIRRSETLWSKKVETGEANMCHSLAESGASSFQV